MPRSKVHANTSAEIKVLYQVHGVRGKKLLDLFPNLSKSTIYEHARKPLGEAFHDRRHSNTGRKRKVDPVLERRIVREVRLLTDRGNGFTSKDVQTNVGALGMSNRTVRRVMNKHGIRYLHLRKKGILLPSDLHKRLKFARKCSRRLLPSFWQRGVSMYIDGVGFEWKTNPTTSVSGTRAMGWRKRSQGLDVNQTAKGKKEGKKNAYFYVGISYTKGVVMCKAYTGRMTAQRYCDHIVPAIVLGLQQSINPLGKRVLQDNCSIMNSAQTKEHLFDNGVKLFKIPARSPDINCIENVFHKMRKEIQKDALTRNITKESFRQFQARCARIIRNFDVRYIDKVINSMPKRIELIKQRRGQRIRY